MLILSTSPSKGPQINTVTRALSLSDAPPRGCHALPLPTSLHPLFINTFLPLSVKQEELLPPQTPFHLLLSPLLYECWGVGRGRPWAGHPVRGLLRVPGLSAGAYRREIHINTCLLCLPPLDTARLPAWHRLHCVGLLSGLFNAALSANLLSVLLLHRRTRADNAEFKKGTLPCPVGAFNGINFVPLDHIWPAVVTACRFLPHAETKRGLKR